MIIVAAAIIEKDGKILICQRGDVGNCSNLWEFPGGKLENGETMEECLIRECLEELDIDIKINSLFAETTYKYPEKEINFSFYKSEISAGKIKAKVHRAFCWVKPEELKKYEFCPADVEIVERLM